MKSNVKMMAQMMSSSDEIAAKTNNIRLCSVNFSFCGGSWALPARVQLLPALLHSGAKRAAPRSISCNFCSLPIVLHEKVDIFVQLPPLQNDRRRPGRCDSMHYYLHYVCACACTYVCDDENYMCTRVHVFTCTYMYSCTHMYVMCVSYMYVIEL